MKWDQFPALGKRKLAGPSTRQIDPKGMIVLPGLAAGDDHIYAQTMARRGLGPVRVTLTSEILGRLRKAVANAKPVEVVFTTAGYLCEPPTAQDLDQISMTVPIIMRRGALGGGKPIMNRAAIRAPDAPPPLVPTGATGELPGQRWAQRQNLHEDSSAHGRRRGSRHDEGDAGEKCSGFDQFPRAFNLPGCAPTIACGVSAK